MDRHLVIARRFRPRLFAEVVGQDHITRVLMNQIKEDKIPQSLIFAGHRGLGKTTTARIFAKAINCLDKEHTEPCNQCSICRQIMQQALIDVIEIDGASNRGIDDVRVIRENTRYLPAQARYKVYIIDEVHMLTREAFNALLKVIEEPPSHIVFILATTQLHSIPDTIRSRCQVHLFKPIQEKDMRQRLGQILAAEKRTIDDAGILHIVQLAQGSMRDAETMLEKVLSLDGAHIDAEQARQILGVFDKQLVHSLLQAVYCGQSRDIVAVFGEMRDRGFDPLRIYGYLLLEYQRIIEEITAGKPLPDNLAADQPPTLLDLLFDLRMLFDIEDKMNRTAYAYLLLESTLIQLARKGRVADIVTIREMINQLPAGHSTAPRRAPKPAAQPAGIDREPQPKAKFKPAASVAGQAEPLDRAFGIIEKQNPLLHGYLSAVPRRMEGDTLCFQLNADNRLCQEFTQDFLPEFEQVLSQVFGRSITIAFRSKAVEKKNDLKSQETIDYDRFAKDDKINMILTAFKGQIETIE